MRYSAAVAFGVIVLVAAALAAGHAAAQTRTPAQTAAPVWPWCAEYDMEGAVVNCGFATREQCMATVSGVGGGCRPNAAVVAPAPKRQGHAPLKSSAR
ncbi:MAG: DUF3551 domain-containing protein [Rhodoplanes sp.]|uniref:DUF3551 domain-containing protein n=1 Tax=Rhodoplanes sp. TaxID=1968906 RepID=UPI001796DB2A|nr:DUF3551 domain-containing protein [Rhodoplanes sp.]NVO14602.1 DUF3551 domain-containing protein [Rhodoplanes sp.]